MRVEHDESGDLWITHMSVICADTLLRIPGLLESDDPDVRARLFPAAYQDPEEEAQWRRLATPELEHLFLSRVEIVRRDLAGMRAAGPMARFEIDEQTLIEMILAFRPEGPDARAMHASYSLCIPAAHKSAWQSSLNAASHALFVLHGLTPGDMEGDSGSLGDDDKDLALMRIHQLGHVLAVLLEADGHSYDPAED